MIRNNENLEVLMKHCIVAMIVLCLSLPTLADDINIPSWRSLPGSTFSVWSYDDDAPDDDIFPRLDVPDYSSFVWGTGLEIPEFKYAEGELDPEDPTDFASQLFAEDAYHFDTVDASGRDGIMEFNGAFSYDLNNFSDFDSSKIIQVQMTWKSADEELESIFAEVDIIKDDHPHPIEDLFEFEFDLFEDHIDLGDGWNLTTMEMIIDPSPDFEAITFESIFDYELVEVEPGEFEEVPLFSNILVDEIIIETFLDQEGLLEIVVPEPATLSMLGLGSLFLMIRKKKLN